MANSRESFYDLCFEGDINFDGRIGNGQDYYQDLSVADKFLINKEIAAYTSEYREKIGENPDLTFAPEIAFFSPRLEQYGFRIGIADHVMKREMKTCEMVCRKKGKRMPEKK